MKHISEILELIDVPSKILNTQNKTKFFNNFRMFSTNKLEQCWDILNDNEVSFIDDNNKLTKLVGLNEQARMINFYIMECS